VANVLFEITTGEKLRGELMQHELASAFDRPLPSARDRGVPEVLDAIISRGLARRPEDRFLDARSMAIALDEASSRLGGESLEEFAQRALAAEHAAHKQQIAELTGVARAPAKTRRGPTVVATGATPPAPTVLAPRFKPRWKILPVIAVLLAAALFLALDEDQPPPAPAPIESAAAEPIAPPVLEAPEEPEPVPEIKPRPRRSRAKKPIEVIEEKRGLGYLTVGAHPYAVVLVDGREHGLTPLLKIPLETGPHQITLLDPASRSVRVSETIEIRADTFINRLYR
jgi:hypothetical protein